MTSCESSREHGAIIGVVIGSRDFKRNKKRRVRRGPSVHYSFRRDDGFSEDVVEGDSSS